MAIIIALAPALFACDSPRVPTAGSPAPAPPVLDGTVGADEWARAKVVPLDTARVLYMTDGTTLHVGLQGFPRGIASLFISDGERVWVLHASAALGSAAYRKEGTERWSRAQSFSWEARDPSDQADRERFRSAHGWLANVSRTGGGDREFSVDLARLDGLRVADARAVFSYLAMDKGGPRVVAWPEVKDAVIDVALQSGSAPESLSFAPETWTKL